MLFQMQQNQNLVNPKMWIFLYYDGKIPPTLVTIVLKHIFLVFINENLGVYLFLQNDLSY